MDGYPQNIDLIFCRNVLIYLKYEHARRILLRFMKTLNEGGYLVLGNIESLDPSYMTFFERLKSDNEYFYRSDGGRSWAKSVIAFEGEPTLSLFGVDVLEDGTIMAVGEFGLIVRSEDQGKTFVKVPYSVEGSSPEGEPVPPSLARRRPTSVG